MHLTGPNATARQRHSPSIPHFRTQAGYSPPVNSTGDYPTRERHRGRRVEWWHHALHTGTTLDLQLRPPVHVRGARLRHMRQEQQAPGVFLSVPVTYLPPSVSTELRRGRSGAADHGRARPARPTDHELDAGSVYVGPRRRQGGDPEPRFRAVRRHRTERLRRRRCRPRVQCGRLRGHSRRSRRRPTSLRGRAHRSQRRGARPRAVKARDKCRWSHKRVRQSFPSSTSPTPRPLSWSAEAQG